MSPNALQLAGKLVDSGPTDEEALEWVKEILAEAWNEGLAAAINSHPSWWSTVRRENPYRAGVEK